MPGFDIPALERMLDQAENNDVEMQGLYNNLGLAHAATRDYRNSLLAHREEKRICKRLLSATPDDPVRHLDLAIAYRRCGDAMLKLDKLVDASGKHLNTRPEIVRAAQAQHMRGYRITRSAPQTSTTRANIALELQAASSALAHSSLALALHTRRREHFVNVAHACLRAARQASRLRIGEAGLSHDHKLSLLLGIAINHSIALSGAGDRARARRMLQAVAMRAIEVDDHNNLVRALSNLGEEASEDADYTLSACYVREWARLARRVHDYADEADALRKLAVVLREAGELHAARDALERALRLKSTKAAKEEAQRFLDVTQNDIDERDDAMETLSRCQREASKAKANGDYIIEAKNCLLAGNSAHILQKYEEVIKILSRYFELHDDFGCNPTLTGVEVPIHNTGVANMGEAMWKLKRYREAVDWASKELAIYDGDIPGQAQAWCNMGVYLDDYGKKERAMDALRRSIELGQKCGETDVAERAQHNLTAVEEELAEAAEKNTVAEIMEIDTAQDVIDDAECDPLASLQQEITRPKQLDNVRSQAQDEYTMEDDLRSCRSFGTQGRGSIIVTSSQPHKKLKAQPPLPFTERSCAASTRRSVHNHPESTGRLRGTEVSIRSGGAFGTKQGDNWRSDAMTEDFSSRATKNVVDIAADYKAICTKRERPKVRVRDMVVSALREMSSALVAREACDTHGDTAVPLHLSGLFLHNEDVSVICKTLAGVGDENAIALNLSLNPFISPPAYDCLRSPPGAGGVFLHSVKSLDVSCAGISAESLRKLADAVAEQGSLAHVKNLNVSKNSLGMQSRAAATAMARVMTHAARVEVFDVSLNLLPNTFLAELVESVELGANATDDSTGSTQSPLRSIDFRMNNRRSPTGLLELSDIAGTVDRVYRLFKTLPCLETINVRACGANKQMRKALVELSSQMTDDRPRNITTVSNSIQDDLT